MALPMLPRRFVRQPHIVFKGTLLVHIFHIEDYIASGLGSVADLPTAIEKEGLDLDQVPFFFLSEGESMWVPWGFVAMVTSTSELSTALALPVFDEDLADQMPQEVKTAIALCILNFALPRPEKPWPALFKSFSEFALKALGVTPPERPPAGAIA
jgi:hypothetical protein